MNFFDKQEVLHPWPNFFRQTGFKFPYKPREVWWRTWLEKMEFKKGERVLEVGCGQGILLDRLASEYGIKGYGIDLSQKAIKKGQQAAINKLNLQFADATKLPFKAKSFDKLISFDTLEHIKDQKKVVSEMTRVLKPKGKLLIYTINKNQRLTWNWLLSKAGVDIYSGVDHDPKLFLGLKWLEETLAARRIRVVSQALFNSFFTLMIDELIMVFLNLWRRFLGWERTMRFATIILGFLTGFSVMVTPVLNLIDWPWRLFGYSNSFLIIGRKAFKPDFPERRF